MRVVLVDDSEPMLVALEEVAVAAGFEVAGTARSAEEALLLIEELRPDAAVVDVRLPGMSGHELADRLRAGPTPRVVLVSATDSGRDERVIPKRSLTPQRLQAALGIA